MEGKMADRFKTTLPSHRITPPEIFFDRRRFLSALGLGLLATPTLFCAPSVGRAQGAMLEPPLRRPDVFPVTRNQDYTLPATIERRILMGRAYAASHNNFYEFLPGRGGPAWEFAGDFEVDPWQVQITGECENPMILDLDDLFAFDHEERVYHFRCVERWAMNVPWSGFPLSRLLEKAERGARPGSYASSARSAKTRCPAPGIALVSVALPRSVADGRGDERAGDGGDRCLRRPTAQTAWGPGPDHRALEVRL